MGRSFGKRVRRRFARPLAVVVVVAVATVASRLAPLVRGGTFQQGQEPLEQRGDFLRLQHRGTADQER
jgi:hypothetical protein